MRDTHLDKLRELSPLVHSLTNYVVMNNTANALLSIGASPVMAHAHPELQDMVKIASSVVVNIGTLDEYWLDSYLMAAQAANELNKPLVLDPVGVGATPYRNYACNQILKAANPTLIRGNASEIMALYNASSKTKGVDSTHSVEDAESAAEALASQYNCIVCVSGNVDLIVSSTKKAKVHNGHPLMSKITGMGCTATAICAAFLAISEDAFEATVSAMACMGVAGEIASDKSEGPGTFQVHFLDALYLISPQKLSEVAKITDGNR
ncbi:MAG: hydroxyethylthiazole kinase [Cyclobacteriaceae bacterium]|nr:hydroxyethylthiazole kinase [Cyclobacteriaceae bacterium]MCH8517600.1 hydroxyethylthiazole kinase [Cyclobacteriaceae bacterium]